MVRKFTAVLIAMLIIAPAAQAAQKVSSLSLSPVNKTEVVATWECNAPCEQEAVGFSFNLKDWTTLPEEVVSKGEVARGVHSKLFTGLTEGHRFAVTIGTCLHTEAGECNEWAKEGFVSANGRTLEQVFGLGEGPIEQTWVSAEEVAGGWHLVHYEYVFKAASTLRTLCKAHKEVKGEAWTVSNANHEEITWHHWLSPEVERAHSSSCGEEAP